MFLHDPNALSRTVPRDSLKQTTPAILIGRLHSYDFRSNCIVNHDLTLCSRLHVTQHFETICANWYYHKSTRFRQPNDGKGKYPQQNQSSFAFAVMYLVLPWGISVFLPWGFWFCCNSCGPPYKIGPLQLAIHVVQNSHAGEQKSHCDKTFVPRECLAAKAQRAYWVCTGLYGW